MKQLDHVAQKIIECFKEAGLDAAYIESKKIELAESDNKFESFLFATSLDDKNTARLAQKLGCSADELDTALSFIKNYL